MKNISFTKTFYGCINHGILIAEETVIGYHVKLKPNFIKSKIFDDGIVIASNPIFDYDNMDIFKNQIDFFFENSIRNAISDFYYWKNRGNEKPWTLISSAFMENPKTSFKRVYPNLIFSPKYINNQEIGRPSIYSIISFFENRHECEEFEQKVNQYMNNILDAYQLAVGMERGYCSIEDMPDAVFTSKEENIDPEMWDELKP